MQFIPNVEIRQEVICRFQKLSAMYRILIADDDLFYRELIRDYLVSQGYFVTTTTNGMDAIREWERASPPYDCIILDIYMSDMFGIDVVEKIRTKIAIEYQDRDIPIIIITGDTSYQAEITARKVNIFSFLLKPFQLKELGEIVKEALKIKKKK